jgi:hypothetical protein
VSARTEGKTMSKDRAIGRAIEQAKTPRAEREDADPPAVREAVVRIFAFSHTRVERDGRPLYSPDWIQKPPELLYYLLSHAEGRTKEQIGLALWPSCGAASTTPSTA